MQLRKRADVVENQAPAAEMHAVRIRAKRLRYMAEFFEPAYGKPAHWLVERVVALQDLLGNLQDGVVSRELIHEAVQSTAGAWPSHTSLALGQLVQFEAQREKELRAAFPTTYRAVREAGRDNPESPPPPKRQKLRRQHLEWVDDLVVVGLEHGHALDNGLDFGTQGAKHFGDGAAGVDRGKGVLGRQPAELGHQPRLVLDKVVVHVRAG